MIVAARDPHVLWVVVVYRPVCFIARIKPNLARPSAQPKRVNMIFIYLHIFAMFLAVALSVGSELVLHRVAATENVTAIRTVFGVAKPIEKAIPMVYGIGFLLGIVAAIVASFNLLALWLLISYVLFIVSSILGGRVVGGWAEKVEHAAAQNQGDAPSEELKALLHDKRAMQGIIANLLVIALIIGMMVFKPFGV
jgi:uncharacterized membrane protein